MLSAPELSVMLDETIMIFHLHSKTPQKATRRFDGATPAGVHSVLLAMLVLHEESLPEELRVKVAVALLGHDMPEDTHLRLEELPFWIKKYNALKLVEALTFDESEDKFAKIWELGDEVILAELFDAVGNLLCAKGVKPERMTYRRAMVGKMVVHIGHIWPDLDILKIAKGLLQ